MLIETLDGKIVSSQAADQRFNPASSIKLATALVALQNFGPNHRFTTGFWTDGSFDKATGTIQGNLYVTGRDPSFHHEHAVMIARQLNNLGIRTVTGDLIVAPGFTMNFNSSARGSGELLYDTLDATLRSERSHARLDLRAHNARRSVEPADGSECGVMGEVHVGSSRAGARGCCSHTSRANLPTCSKCCSAIRTISWRSESATVSAEKSQSTRQLVDDAGNSPDEVQFASLSGLGVNRVTPRAMMKIFRGLRNELQKNRLSPADIMPVAGIDPGTLEDRFTGPAWQGSVIAKTGTLIRTDGGASSLVGQMRTANGDTLLFVIMNQHGNVVRFRSNQDYLVMQVQNSRGGPKAFNYKPLALTMKLADTESISGSASGRTRAKYAKLRRVLPENRVPRHKAMRPADHEDRRGALPSSLRARRAAPRTKRTIFSGSALQSARSHIARSQSRASGRRFLSNLKFESSQAFAINTRITCLRIPAVRGSCRFFRQDRKRGFRRSHQK